MQAHEIARAGCLLILAPIWVPILLGVVLFAYGVIVPLRLLLAVPAFTIAWMVTGDWDGEAFKRLVFGWD